MKIKSGFVLHTIGSEHVAAAVGPRTEEFRGMIRLNATGAFLWEQLQREHSADSLAQALMAEYEITEDMAIEAVSSFVGQLSAAGVLE